MKGEGEISPDCAQVVNVGSGSKVDLEEAAKLPAGRGNENESGSRLTGHLGRYLPKEGKYDRGQRRI